MLKSINLLEGLPNTLNPQDITFITVRLMEIEVMTDTFTGALKLNTPGCYNPFPGDTLLSYPSLKRVTFVFPDSPMQNDEWGNLLLEMYGNYIPPKVTFTLQSKLGSFMHIKETLFKEEATPQPVTTGLDTAEEFHTSDDSEPYNSYDEDDEEYEEYDEYDDEDDEYEDDEYDDEYDEDEDEYDEDEDEEYDDENDAEYSNVGTENPSTVEASETSINSERDTEIMAFSEELVTTILDIYNKIYPQCYVQRPYGILTSKGIITYDSTTQNIGILKRGLDNFIIQAYNRFVQEDGTITQFDSMNISSAISNKGMLYNYMPLLQAEIAFGIKRCPDGSVEIVNNWGEYTDYLHSRIKGVVFNLLRTRQNTFDVTFQTQIVSILTNTVVLLEYDKSKAMHLLYKQSSCKLDFATYLTRNAQELFAKTGEVINHKPVNDEFTRFLYAFNPKAYHSEILFAYKMYSQLIASGATPSAKELIIGRTLDGNDMKLDLENRQDIIGAIMAGPRSGKGVLTLSVLAGLMAHERDNRTIPFIYLDGKPEMSATLWEMERTLQAQGVDAKILAIEGLNQCTDSGVGPNRGNRILEDGTSVWDFGRNLPDGVELSGLSVLPYLKMMQLYTAMAKGSFRSIKPYTERFARVMLIMDETIAIKAQYNDFCASLYEYLKLHKPKAKDTPTPEYLYVKKLATVLTHMVDTSLLLNGQMTSKFVGTLVSEGPKKGFGVIQIGQFTTPGQWQGVQPTQWDKNPFGFLMKNATWRILGKNSGQSKEYGLSELKAEGMSLVGKLEKGDSPDSEKGQLGYFAYLNGATSDATVQKVFKSYLALNENDFNPENESESGIFTRQLLSNAGDEMTRKSLIKEDLLRQDGSVRTEVGFMGLAQMLMSNPNKLVERLTAGYNIVWEFMQANGLAERYTCVEDYLVDCSPESIFTLEELANGVQLSATCEEGGELDYNPEELDSTLTASPVSSQPKDDLGNMPQVTASPKIQPVTHSNSTHFKPTVPISQNYSTPVNTLGTPTLPKETQSKELTVRDLMGDKLYNTNLTYLNQIRCSVPPQDSVRSRELICHKPFQVMDVRRVEPLSEILVPGIFNIEWVTNTMCKSKWFSGLGRKLKQQRFYKDKVSKKETKTMLLSIAEVVGGLNNVTHLDIVDCNLMFNNLDFNYSGEITLDGFDVFQLHKLVNLKVLGTDVPLALHRILSGLKCTSIDDLWETFEHLDEVQCMGQAYKRYGSVADKTSIFRTEKEHASELTAQISRLEQSVGITKEESPTIIHTDSPIKVESDSKIGHVGIMDDVLSELPSLELSDEDKIAKIEIAIDELCMLKYNRILPITVKDVPDIDYWDAKAVTNYAVKCIIDYLK